MHVFVTGAAGYIGQAVTKELIAHGHTVLALVRSDANAAIVTKLGATPHKGNLDDPESLRAGAAQADGVIHLAFNHDWNNLAGAMATDQANITAMGQALAGTNKPLVIASGILLLPPGKLGHEDDDCLRENNPMMGRVEAADIVYKLARENQVRGIVVRIPPTVHGEGDKGFMASIIDLARKNKSAMYIGDGSQRWAAVNRFDAASLFRLALEHGRAGATYHVVGEEAVPMKDIATLIGNTLNVPVESKTPEEAGAAMGFFGFVVGFDNPASSAKTQQELGWKPTHPGLLNDLAKYYFGDVPAAQ